MGASGRGGPAEAISHAELFTPGGTEELAVNPAPLELPFVPAPPRLTAFFPFASLPGCFIDRNGRGSPGALLYCQFLQNQGTALKEGTLNMGRKCCLTMKAKIMLNSKMLEVAPVSKEAK